MAVTTPSQRSSETFVPTPLQADLAAAAREFLSRHAEPSTKNPERSGDVELWRRVGMELGWAGITIAERHGGLGLTFADLCVVVEEAGRVLLGVPLADNAICAAGIATYAPPRAAESVLPSMAAGERFGTVAFDSLVKATRVGTSVRLSGEARFVIHGRTADLALVPARGDAGPLLVLVQGLALGAADRRNILATDQTRPVGLIRFDASEVPADAVLQEGAAAEAAVARLRGMRAVALANESVGGADRALEMATAYALQREQFGRIIGSFQAIKHKLANMLVLVEHARTAARYAAASPVDEERDLLFRAAVAKAYCGDACVSVAADTIQVHGGIGFTWEHAAHLYYKRACLNAELVWSTLSCREFIRRSLFG